MQGIVAIEKSLSNLAEVLESEGYEVVTLDDNNINSVDAIIVSGADINLLNIQDALTDVPVINATGKTFNEIIRELEKM
ncbi:MAG: YkuS family protein [Sporomusaceae bacterium]|nr:YkuS family protein [Sporomusaceae bacterium]